MKMHMKLAWLLVLLVLPGIAQANPESLKAGTLVSICEQFVATGVLGGAQAGSPSFVRDVRHRAGCSGYMDGWKAGLDGTLTPDPKTSTFLVITVEDGVTGLQMAKVFSLYMANHPEEENKPAHVNHAGPRQIR